MPQDRRDQMIAASYRCITSARVVGSTVKTTAYFDSLRSRPDRALIQDDWIRRAIEAPIREQTQADGRIRRWCRVPEMDNRYLRVILLPDGATVHNAFFDRDFLP